MPLSDQEASDSAAVMLGGMAIESAIGVLDSACWNQRKPSLIAHWRCDYQGVSHKRPWSCLKTV